MPEGYPAIDALKRGRRLAVPRCAVPFRSIVAASRSDPSSAGPLLPVGRARVDIGEVGHLNPASGFGDGSQACGFIEALDAGRAPAGPVPC